MQEACTTTAGQSAIEGIPKQIQPLKRVWTILDRALRLSFDANRSSALIDVLPNQWHQTGSHSFEEFGVFAQSDVCR